MNKSDRDEGFIGPIKPLMSMSYRDYLRMINTGLGLPRFPRPKLPSSKGTRIIYFHRLITN